MKYTIKTILIETGRKRYNLNSRFDDESLVEGKRVGVYRGWFFSGYE